MVFKNPELEKTHRRLVLCMVTAAGLLYAQRILKFPQWRNGL